MIQGLGICIVVTHIFACFWFMSSKMSDFNPDTWVYRMNMIDSDPSYQYLQSFYWSA